MRAIVKRPFIHRRRDGNIASASMETVQDSPKPIAICSDNKLVSPTRADRVGTSDALGTDCMESFKLQSVNNAQYEIERSSELEVENGLTQAFEGQYLPIDSSEEAGTGLIKSRSKLQEVAQQLNLALESYAKGHARSLHFKEDALRSLVDSAKGKSVQAAAQHFGQVLQDLSVTQVSRRPGWLNKFGEYLSKLYPLASLTLGLASAGAEGATLMPLKGAANAISLLLSIAIDEYGRPGDFVKQLDRISFQSHRIAEIQKYPSVVTSDILLEKSVDLMTAILMFLYQSLIYFKHDYFYRVGITVLQGPQIYSDAKSNLNVAIADYDQAILAQIVIVCGVIHQMSQRETTNSGFLEWLEPSTSQTEGQLFKNSKLRAPSTLKWVHRFPEFSSWRLREEVRSVLWLSGLPGVGKSVISAYLINILRIQYPSAVVLYFFAKSGGSGINTASDIIRTLTAQLVAASPDTQLCIERTYQQLKSGDKNSRDINAALLVKDIFGRMVSASAKPVYLVLDGLDECKSSSADEGENGLEEFLDALLSLDCRILISSRPTYVLTGRLRDSPTRLIGFEENCIDIELLVKFELERSPYLRAGFEKIGINAAEHLAKRAEGNFLWVATVLKLLGKTRSLKLFKSTFDSFPSALRELYDAVIEKVEEEGILEWVLSILEWIVYSYRPLSIQELQTAVEMDLEDEILNFDHFIMVECGAFLSTVSHEDGGCAVQIGHETFRSYITDPVLCKHSLRSSAAQARMARVCFDVLNEKSSTSRNLLNYALWHSFDHLSVCTFVEGRTCSLSLSLKTFLNGKGLRTWITQRTLKSSGFEMWKMVADAYDNIILWTNLQSCSDVNWVNSFSCENIGLDKHLCATVTNIWLGTMWNDWDCARFVYMSALKICRIFGFVGPKVPPQLHFLPSKNWASFTSSYDYIASPQQLEKLFSLGNFNPDSKGHSFAAGMAYFHSSLDGAKEFFLQACDEEPENFLPLEGLGHLHCDRLCGSRSEDKDEQKALEYFRKAISLDSREVAGCSKLYWTVLSDTRKQEGDIEGARQALQDALNLPVGRREPIFWRKLATLCKENSDIEGAREVYRTAIRTHPEGRWQYWDDLVEIEREVKDFKAETLIRLEAMAYEPDRAYNHRSKICDRAEVLFDCQAWELTCEILLLAIEGDYTKPEKYIAHLARTYLAWGRWTEALNRLLSLPTESYPFRLWTWMGHAHLALGNFDKAISAYKQSIKEDGTIENFANLGRTYVHSGQPALAIRELKQAIRRDDELGGKDSKWKHKLRPYVWLAETYNSVGKFEDARAQYSRAKEIGHMIVSDRDPDRLFRSRGRDHVIMARILERLGDIDGTKEHLQKAIMIFEGTSYIEDDEMEQSEHAEAVEELSRLSTDPPSQSPPQEESQKLFRLRRDLVFTLRVNLGVRPGSSPPRSRRRIRL